MTPVSNPWLLAAGGGSITAALLHLACMISGPGWFRFLGAGEGVAQAVEQGRILPYAMTAGIAAVLLGWGYYAFAAAGLAPRPPLIRLGLIAITVVLLVRAFALFYPDFWLPEHTRAFQIVSSLIVLALGLSFLFGTIRAWPVLSMRS